MRRTSASAPFSQRKNFSKSLLLCIVSLLLNLLGVLLTKTLQLPIYLDTIGTIFAAAVGGYLPGLVVGVITNLVKGFWAAESIYYVSVSVLTALLAAFFTQKGAFKRFWPTVWFVLLLTAVSVALSTALTWFLFGFAGEPTSGALVLLLQTHLIPDPFFAELAADGIVNLADKILTVLIVLLLLAALPEQEKSRLRFAAWRQKPLSPEQIKELRSVPTRKMSLRPKLLLIVTLTATGIAVISMLVSSILYHRTTIEEQTQVGQSIATIASKIVEADRVDDYLAQGENAEGYLETKQRLTDLRDSTPEVEYIYVYRILDDGCHVVFDLDTEELAGEAAGTVIPFDESFLELVPALLAGEPIDPIITNDTYGWLLTVYVPVYNEAGECQCYAAADVSMSDLIATEQSFHVKQIAIFLGFFALILGVSLWLADYNLIFPLNTMAQAAGSFASDDEDAYAETAQQISALDIHTGDELENLYTALSKTTEDMARYIADIQAQNETITRMQNGLIMVLADMVESRDQCTGDHVRKTAAYVRILLTRLQAKGYYPELLTEKYISNVVNSAPLHDVGKIKIPDAILNKPGKLTDEEFNIMRSHTTAGAEIIEQAKTAVSESGYLHEAKDLAKYHHERWDGNGYPSGLAGDDIPLSARVMAVADVFDALVSRRSYKAPFSFEDSVQIIRQGSGTQFDPTVVEAFLDSLDEVRAVAEGYAEA